MELNRMDGHVRVLLKKVYELEEELLIKDLNNTCLVNTLESLLMITCVDEDGNYNSKGVTTFNNAINVLIKSGNAKEIKRNGTLLIAEPI